MPKENAMRLREFVSNTATRCLAGSPAVETERKHGAAALLLLWACFVVLVPGCETKHDPAATAAPAPSVQVAQVIQKDVPVYHEWVATLDGFVNAQIQPQVSGYLIQQTYQEGQ